MATTDFAMISIIKFTYEIFWILLFGIVENSIKMLCSTSKKGLYKKYNYFISSKLTFK